MEQTVGRGVAMGCAHALVHARVIGCARRCGEGCGPHRGNAIEQGLDYGSFRLLTRWRERLRGLLCSSYEDASQVMLYPCSSIHTFGMGYPLDVALVGRAGTVLRVARGMQARRLLLSRHACCALERPAMNGPWPQLADVVVIQDERGRILCGPSDARRHL